ncbi:MAG: Ig-like domain-containing protein, partial [Ruminococcus sp.]|nr:Ig-like domain-containing protein [Ruminococcus sp.]
MQISALSVSAVIYDDQTANAGKDYDFILQEVGTGVQTIEVSSEEVAAGDVTKSLSIYLDSEEWDEDNYIAHAMISWAATKDATLVNGGEIYDDIYFENTIDVSAKDMSGGAVDYTASDGSVISASASYYSNIFCLAPLVKVGTKYRYQDAECSVTTQEIQYERKFGAAIEAVSDNVVQFTCTYIASAEDYENHVTTTETKTCEVQYKDDGTPYITYDYISQDTFETATTTLEMPRYTTTRFVESNGVNYVPGTCDKYLWTSYSGQTSYVGGSSTLYPFTGFDVVIPQGTPDGVYYVQLCSRTGSDEICALHTVSDFDSLKAEQAADSDYKDTVTKLMSSDPSLDIALPGDESKTSAVVEIVVGDVSTTTTTTADTTTTDEVTLSSDNAPIWKIQDAYTEAGDEEFEYAIEIYNGVASAAVCGGFVLPEVTRAIVSAPDGCEMKDVVYFGNAYSSLTALVNVEKYYDTNGMILFSGVGSEVAPAPEDGSSLIDMVLSIADEDTVKSVAAEYGLSLQIDENGKTYYSFPVIWAKDEQDPGETVENGQAVTIMRNRYAYYDGDENGEDIYKLVDYQEGSINVYVSDVTTTTTTETATTTETTTTETTTTTTTAAPATTTSTELAGKSVWSLDTQTVTAGDSYQDVYFNISITNPIDSQGLQFALELPDETIELLYFAYGEDTIFNNGVYYPMATTMATMRFIEAGEGKLIYAMMNITTVSPVTELEPQLVELDFQIPSEDEVIAIAQKYELELQHDADGNAYYSFPINFMEPGQDAGETIDTSTGDIITVMRDRFNYMNADGTVDVFSDYVELVDGALNIIVDEAKTTTTTAPTTALPDDLTVDPSELNMEVGDTDTLTPNFDDCTFESADNSIASVDADGNVTANAAGTTTITVTDQYGRTYVVTVNVTETTTLAPTTSDTTTDTTALTTVTTTAKATTTAAKTTTKAATTTKKATTKATTTAKKTTTTSISATLKADASFYFSVDDRDFDPTDLLTVYSIDESGNKTDITDQVTFDYDSPKALFDANNKAYCVQSLTAKVGSTTLSVSPKVYIGVKGDTNLNGDTDIYDANESLLYYSNIKAGNKDYTFIDNIDGINSSDKNLETLIFFLSDIDTESKTQGDGGSIEIVEDCYNNLLYYSNQMASTGKTW